MIPEAAVEAAAKALYKGQPLYDEEKGIITGHRPWEWMTPDYQQAQLDDARAALEAAAPHMLAMAWEQGREHGIDECAGDTVGATSPYRTASAE